MHGFGTNIAEVCVMFPYREKENKDLVKIT